MDDINDAARCDLCGAELANEDLLRDHREGMHGSRCPQCGADFTTGALLANHLEGHHGEGAAGVLAQEQGELKP
jgi:NAD-dependent SIR2 family protein deacetylase